MEFDPNDAEDAVDELTTALTQLLAVLHAGRDRLEEPLATLVRRAEEVPALADLLLENAHLSPLGRLCFDYVWVAKMRAGCVGMFDVDGLRHLNAARGPAVARRALQAIADLAREALPADVTLARLAGKQFVVCLPDSSAEGAAEIVECVRQRIEHARLQAAGKEVRLTVSAAVVTRQGEETSAAMLARLRDTIQEAKTYGRNRTFLCESAAPTPVAPLKLPVEERVVAL
jgi:diguanylate cyclase (GGDEF)-like protein